MARKSRTPWVVVGGKLGELGHCERCGRGLELGGSQPLPIAVAAMRAFVGMHKSCREGDYKEPPTNTPEAWLEGRDTGISSCTIYAVMMNVKTPMSRYDVPHDPDDFGRCYRLLGLFPEWRLRLGEVVERFPKWKLLVEHWDELTVMYEFVLQKDDHGRMYKRMCELRKEK